MMDMELPTTQRKIRRFKSDLAKADRKRELLLSEGRLSIESGAGKLAILVSTKPSRLYSKHAAERLGITEQTYLNRQIESFENEASRISDKRADQHRSITRLYATESNLERAFGSQLVSDIVLIGHGSINSIWSQDGNFDWIKASRSTEYLKQGVVEQRTCGHFPNNDARNVPLGTFAVSNFSNVLAIAGYGTTDSDPGDGVFRPVFNDRDDIMIQLRDLNQKHA